jgi:hypothetical protein
LNLSFVTDNPVSFVRNAEDGINFDMNSEWAYRGGAESHIFISNSSGTSYTDAIVVLPIERYANGVIIRLAMPITLLLLLAGATFWVGNPGARISASTGLLIAVTAIYIVILGAIPFVGYATTIDTFVLVMLALLVAVVLVHVLQMYLHNTIYGSEATESEETLVSTRSMI